jgi:hypothetical protein
MSNISDIRILISQLRLLTRAQVQIFHLVKDKAKNKKMEDCTEEDYDDTIQLRFVAGGRIPLSVVNEEDSALPPKEYEEIVEEMRGKIAPLQDFLLKRMHAICNKETRDINDIEELEKTAKWIELSEEEFCQFRAEDDAPGAIEFLEKWSLYYKREDREGVESVLTSIQDIIDRYTKDQRDELAMAIGALTDACPV